MLELVKAAFRWPSAPIPVCQQLLVLIVRGPFSSQALSRVPTGPYLPHLCASLSGLPGVWTWLPPGFCSNRSKWGGLCVPLFETCPMLDAIAKRELNQTRCFAAGSLQLAHVHRHRSEHLGLQPWDHAEGPVSGWGNQWSLWNWSIRAGARRWGYSTEKNRQNALLYAAYILVMGDRPYSKYVSTLYSMLEGAIHVVLIAITRTHKIIIKDYVTTSMKTPWGRYKDRNGKYVEGEKQKTKTSIWIDM